MFTDEQDIDRQLRAALDVTPSAGFEAGVRRRLAADGPRTLWHAPAWLAAAAAAVVIALGGWYLAVQNKPVPDQEVRTAAAPDIPLAALETPGVRPVARGSSPARTARAVGREARPASVEVIVPPGQLAAIERLVREVNAGRAVLPEPSAAPPPPAPLVVAPLVVGPIPLVSVEPGGGSQSGAKGLQ